MQQLCILFYGFNLEKKVLYKGRYIVIDTHTDYSNAFQLQFFCFIFKTNKIAGKNHELNFFHRNKTVVCQILYI